MCYTDTCILQKPWLSFTRAQHTCVQAEHGQVLHSLHQGSQAPEVTGIAWGLIHYAWVGPARCVSVSRDPMLQPRPPRLHLCPPIPSRTAWTQGAPTCWRLEVGRQPPEEPAPHRTSRLHGGRFSSHHFLFNQPAPCWLGCPSGGRCLRCPFRSQRIWEEPESVTGHRHCSLLEAKLLKM